MRFCFSNLFNFALQHVAIATAWKHLNIIPVHKGKSMSGSCNYYLISVVPVIVKVMEKHFCSPNQLPNAKVQPLKRGIQNVPKIAVTDLAISQ